MSTHEIRTFTATGEQDRVLGGVKPEFTDEFLNEGAVTLTLPQKDATEYGLAHSVEAAVFRDGVEIEGSRAILNETTGNEAEGDDAPGTGYEVTWAGQTLLSDLKQAIVYPAEYPVDPDVGLLNQVFHSERVGAIYMSLFDQAKTRGAIPRITRTTWNDLTDSAGIPWAHKATLEYRPGVTLLQALESLAAMGAVEWRMVGRDLRLYNVDGVGRDLTVSPSTAGDFTVTGLGDGTYEVEGTDVTAVGDGTFTIPDEHARPYGDDSYLIASEAGSLPVVLRRGMSVTDTPYSESTAEVYNTLLMMGNDGLAFEKEDAESIALYGRKESMLSNDSMKADTLNALAESSLERHSMMRGEYTCKIEIGAPGPVPWEDFNLGDWVFLDRKGENSKYRVRQMSLTWEDERYVVVVTLNDKFAELDLKTAKSMDGILGGAVQDNLRPADPPEIDRTIPNPPLGVASSSEEYTDPVSGESRSVVTTHWNGVTHNTDGTQITDLSGYDVEDRRSTSVSHLPPTEWYPAALDARLQSRWDRRGKDTENNWVGGDGGSSVRAPNGEDWFFWSDTAWGTIDADGTTHWNSMPRSSITKSDPTVLNDLHGFAGMRNMLPVDKATLTTTSGWSATRCSNEIVTAEGGYENRWLKSTKAEAQTAYTYYLTADGTAVPGVKYLFTMKIDPASTAAAQLWVKFYDAAGAQTSGGEVRASPGSDGWVRELSTAPPDASSYYVMLYMTGDVGTWAAFTTPGVFQTREALQTWSSPVADETVTNEVLNPDGADVVPEASSETARNYVTNPVAAEDLTGWSALGAGSEIARLVDGVTVPEVVNPSALDPWLTSLGEAATRSVGVGVIGDSTAESTGDPSNPDLSDRFIERLQLALRKETAVAGIPVSPEGYYGASTYVPVAYHHPGPVDWVFESADPVKYPIRDVQGGRGAGGRARPLSPGVRAHFTATFTRFRLAYGKSGFGRRLRVILDGVEQTVIDTYGPDETGYWTSPYLGEPAEHTVVFEYVKTDGLADAESTLLGVDLWEYDNPMGVRVYDLSGSGKAARDVATGNREMDDDFARDMDLLVLDLGFNDFGRAQPWGPPITAAEFKADVETIIAGARSRGMTGPVLLMGQWEAPQLTPGVAGETLANFRAQLKAIAQADSTVAFIDLSTVMPDTDYAPWGQESYYVDGLHPSMKGHDRIAGILHRTLTGEATGPEAVRVSTPAATQRGVEITLPSTAAWPGSAQYAGGALVTAPVGAQMQLRVLAAGTAGTTTAFTGTGSPQWVSSPVASASGASAAPRVIVRTTTAEATEFNVTDVAIVRGEVGAGFNGATAPSKGHSYEWVGTPWLSESIQRRTSPVGWTPLGTAAAEFDPTVYQQGQGSVEVISAAASKTVGVEYALPSNIPASSWVTVVALARADFPIEQVTLRTKNTVGTVIGSAVETYVQPDGWVEVRLHLRNPSVVRHLQVDVEAPNQQAAGAVAWFSELTTVVRDGSYWRGSPFHGGQSGPGVVTAWEGAPNQSRSVGTFRNSSSAPSFGQAGSLFHPSAAGGNASEYVWVTGAAQHPTQPRAFVVCNGMRDRAMRDGSGWNFQRTGPIFLAEYDLQAERMVSWNEWFTDPAIQWGEAMVADGQWLYVYGASGNPGQMHVMRVPADDPLNGAREMWNGTAWVAFAPQEAAVLATMQAGGAPTGVRTFEGKWIAVYCAGYMDAIEGWSAPAPQGPWTFEHDVYRFPTGPEHSLKYVPRFHPQMDGGEGVVVGFSEAGQNGVEVYGQTLVRGPRGEAVHNFTNNDMWGWRRFADTSPDNRAGLIPGTAYQVRVRARDESDNVSTWTEGAVITLVGDTEGPPQPDAPVVETFFGGVRVYVSGLSVNGAAMPGDFSRFTVHISTSESFEPSNANLVDSLATRGGVSVISGLDWGKAYYVRLVAWDTTGNQSPPSDSVMGRAERLSDEALPENLIDGAKHIKEESLSVKHFSVGAFGNSLVPNPDMEDGVPGELPVGWSLGWPRGEYTDWDTAGYARLDDTNPIAGAMSLRIDNTAVSSRQVVSRVFPVVPGDVYYISAKVRTSQKVSSDLIQTRLLCGTTAEFVNGFMDPRSVNLDAGVTDGVDGGSVVTVEGQVEVPDLKGDGSGEAMKFAAFGFDTYADGQSGYTTWLDGIEVRQIVGTASLANASINRAKIRYLAVDDARIASMSVGKLVAGELWADITVSARIMTAKVGQRVELNKDGLFGYNGTDVEPVTEVRADNGGLVSRWFRTNTQGTRIEMGTYGMGANSALIAFFDDSSQNDWQFPPAVGFGGTERRGNIPGLAMHAGSKSVALYNKHGMNMIGVDQVGGIALLTGNRLAGNQSTVGAPITINAGGPQGVVDISSGGYNASANYARLKLSGVSKESLLSLHRGPLLFGGEYVNDEWQYGMQYTWAHEWGGFPHNHINMWMGSGGGFRIGDSNNADQLHFRLGTMRISGKYKGPGWNESARIKTQGTDEHYASIFYDGTNIGVMIYTNAGTQVAAKNI